MRFRYFFVLLPLVLCTVADYSYAETPIFASAHGITVLSSVQLNHQLHEVSLASREVRGDQTIRILLPRGYGTTTSNSRRYPVLYLLHGSFGGAADWTTAGAAQEICGNASLITVMPNGDPFGFYTNWVIPGNATPQNWRTYHMEQLVPWIDFNLRTVARKQGRAIAGLSMGGFGAIRYAEQYPYNFAMTVGFSGALDLLDIRVQQIILDLAAIDRKPLLGPFGSPFEPENYNGWLAQDPIRHAASLRNVAITLYTGNGDTLELTLRDANNRMRVALNLLNIPFYFNDYGNGQSIGYDCDGGHNWSCWKASLIHVLPRIMAVLHQQY